MLYLSLTGAVVHLHAQPKGVFTRIVRARSTGCTACRCRRVGDYECMTAVVGSGSIFTLFHRGANVRGIKTKRSSKHQTTHTHFNTHLCAGTRLYAANNYHANRTTKALKQTDTKSLCSSSKFWVHTTVVRYQPCNLWGTKIPGNVYCCCPLLPWCSAFDVHYYIPGILVLQYDGLRVRVL